MEEDKVKANGSYLGLSFSYFFVLILRLVNFVPYEGNADIKKIRNYSVKLSLISVFYIYQRKYDMVGFYEKINISFSILGLSIAIFVSTLTFAIIAYTVEEKLYIRCNTEFYEYEERMGRRKNSYFARKVCIFMKKMCDEFLSFGWMLVLPIALIIIVYYQFMHPPTGEVVNQMSSYVASIALVIAFGWKRTAPMYFYRKRTAQENSGGNTYTSSSGKHRYRYNNSYNTQDTGKNDDNNEAAEDNEWQDPVACGYFNGCSSLSDLKKTYRKLVKRMHPDAGGNVDDFQRMNNEYEYVLKKWGKK